MAMVCLHTKHNDKSKASANDTETLFWLWLLDNVTFFLMEIQRKQWFIYFDHSAQFWLGVHCWLYHYQYHCTSCAPKCTTAGLLCTYLNFDARIWNPCITLTHTYFQSNRDSQWSFSQISASTKTSSARFRTQNCACLTTFLSTMLIGLNVISGSCVSKQIGQKFSSFLCCHFLSMLSLPFYVFVFTSAENK